MLILKKYILQPVALAFLLVGIAACSSPESKPLAPLEDEFSTQEFSNGLQVFTYKVFFPVPEASPAEADKRTRKPASRGGKLLRIDERLALRLAAEDYCPKGYQPLERFIGFGSARIRGECR